MVCPRVKAPRAFTVVFEAVELLVAVGAAGFEAVVFAAELAIALALQQSGREEGPGLSFTDRK